MPERLTAKQRAFVLHYVQCRNATEAARLAGYAGDDNTLGVVGHENLRKPKIKVAIEEHYESLAMEATEALALVGQRARGPDIAKLARVYMAYEQAEKKNKSAMAAALGMIDQLDLGKFIRGIKATRHGLELRLTDPQSATAEILRGLGVFKQHMVLEDYHTVAIEAIRKGEISYEAALEATNDLSQVNEWFRLAGVQVSMRD